MKMSGTCPKCGDTRIISNATVIDRDHGGKRDLTVATFRDKSALIFDGKLQTALSAWVCSACGFTELYARHPFDLIESEN